MTRRLEIEEPGGLRTVTFDELPLVVGGPGADVETRQAPGPLAFIGAEGADLFVQPAEGAVAVRCNGEVLETSRWIRDGDVLTLDGIEIGVKGGPDAPRLTVREAQPARPAAPRLTPPPRPTPPGPASGATMIAPAEFVPQAHFDSRGPRRWGRPVVIATWTALAALAALAWFVFTARAVEIRVSPEPDSIGVRGAFFAPRLGGSYLLRPGEYTVAASRQGYQPLLAPLVVSDDPRQVHDFELAILPGLLTVITIPEVGATVRVDGELAGSTPLDKWGLAAGDHTISVQAERFRPVTAQLSIEGAGQEERLEVRLEPLWASVSFASSPGGATVRVGGEALGRTPFASDLMEGVYDVEFRLAGHKPYRTRIRIAAGEPQTVTAPVLSPVDAGLTVTTEPPGATVEIDGRYAGVTPLDLELEPGVEHAVRASSPGHRTHEQRIRIASGETRELHMVLEAEYGEVELALQPPDVEILVDGEVVVPTGTKLRLPATPHEIEVRKQGFQSVQRTVTPRPGFPQRLELRLLTEEEAREAARVPMVRSPQGQEMRLIAPGRFQMGASRREPGRRANETLREIELTRYFYLATEEVSNAEFREFRDAHRAGSVGSESLDLEGYPVVGVTWEDAARYCNWLSRMEGMRPVYVEVDGTLKASRTPGNGYRLPTEAEWTWVARYEAGASGRKYPWGDALPVAPGSGNFADESASRVLSSVLAGYNDGYPATAPVDSFEPNSLGIFHLGGNVAEWMHDYYSIYSSASSSVEQDPVGPEEGEFRVIRGPSWMDSTITELRWSYRDYSNKPRPDVGFRIARYAD